MVVWKFLILAQKYSFTENSTRSLVLYACRPFAGEFLADDLQRRLDIPKPRLPNGDCPTGFLGYAVNMINIDRTHLFFLTASGYGLRETLFYSLFSCMQVYKTRAEMLQAFPCITDGALSLDGGIIKRSGLFCLGNRYDALHRNLNDFSIMDLNLYHGHWSQLLRLLCL